MQQSVGREEGLTSDPGHLETAVRRESVAVGHSRDGPDAPDVSVGQNLNDKKAAVSYHGTMTKFTGLALMVAVAFAVTPAFAHDPKDKEHSCCATKGTMDCAATYAKLNLSPEQKTKMDALVEKCKGTGCTKESMEAFMKSAEGVLSKEQFTALKAECAKLHDKGAKA